jgi:molybdate transport system regulatory protein
MEPRLKLWLEIENQVVLSDWRVSLLQTVDHTGSLSRAAEELGVPYRTAWHKLKQMEVRLGVRLVESHSGGAEGGSTRLTPAARLLIERFTRFSDGLRQEVERRYATAFADLPLALAGQAAASGDRPEH